MSLTVLYAPSLVALRAGYVKVSIIFCNTFISSYSGWCFLLCTFRPPTVSRRVFGGTDVLSVGRVSGSAGPQFNNCARGPFCGPRDPEGSECSRLFVVYYLFVQYVVSKIMCSPG